LYDAGSRGGSAHSGIGKDFKMTRGWLGFYGVLTVGIALLPLLSTNLAGQTRGTSPTASTNAGLKRTAWGDPDIEGLWTNTTTTPLERLPEAGEKTVLTEDEREALARRVQERLDQDKPGRAGQVVPYNEFWYERGTLSNRTSLIVDPPDGRIPALTPAAAKRRDEQNEHRRQHPADSWLDRSAYDRCISRGMPGEMIPGFYNHNYQIVQAPGYVAIQIEMIHDVRIVPLDGRPHLTNTVAQWLGDSRGHWDGNTLVIDTTNFNDKVFERGAAWGFGATMHMVERFTRIDADHLDYQFTIDDPATFTRPWTVSTPMLKTPGPLLEYACHEGNHALPGILGGARADERKAAQKTGVDGPR
jgi:hypothetical protein